MGKLSSFCGGNWRAGWLALSAALMMGVGALFVLGDSASAKPRRDRFNDGPFGNNYRDNDGRGSSDTSSRGNSDAGRGNSSGGNTNNSSGRDASGKDDNGKGDKGNDKNAKAKDNDDDDDDGRGGAQRDAGKGQGKTAGGSGSGGGGKGKGDDADPPKTVVEMLQRMFPAGASGTGDGKASNRADDTSGKPGDGDKPAKANTPGKTDQAASPTPARGGGPAADTPQAKRAQLRMSNPGLGWQRDTRASDLFRRDEILVVDASRSAMAQLRFAHVETITTGGSSVSRFLVPDGLDAISARQLLREQAPSLLSAFNYVYRPYVAATEAGGIAPGLGQAIRPSSAKGCAAERCYGPTLIHWSPEATGCTIEIGVGVIDTGFDSQHPAFKDRKINWSTVLEGEHVSVQAWHGTGVLALLSGNPQSTTPGLIPNATFTATNTFYSDASGQPATDTTTLIKALKLMETYKVKVVNLSLAGPQDAVLHKQIKEMSETGVLFVAAAGNGGPFALPSYPAAYPEVIAVTAVDRNLVGYRHATRGSHIDLAAPGVDIWTALPDKREGPQTGTSFAVPYVTAAAAAVYPKEELVYKGRPLDPKQAVLSRLTTRDLGPAGRDAIYGQGLLQAPAKCADKSGPEAAVEVSSAWSPTLEPVVQPSETGAAAGLMSLTPSAEVRWPGVVQHLSFQPER
jgi:Subtilase family